MDTTEIRSLTELMERALPAVEVVVGSRSRPARVDINEYREFLRGGGPYQASDVGLMLRYAEPRLRDEGIKEDLTQAITQYFGHFIVDDRIQTASYVTFGGPGDGFPLDVLLAHWLKIAVVKGAAFAAKAFADCVDGIPARIPKMTFLKGIHFQNDIEIDDGIRLVPTPNDERELPNYLPHLTPMRYSPGPSDFTSSVILVVDHVISPVFANPEVVAGYPPDQLTNEGGPFSRRAVSTEFPNFNPWQFCEVLSLSADCHATAWVEWYHMDPNHLWSLSTSSGFSFYDRPQRSQSKDLDGEQIREATLLYKAHESLDEETSAWLQMPIYRWLQANVGQSFADQLIDLGIALESFYINDRSPEIRFRLAQHGAWYLGRCAEHRKRIARDLRHIYDQRSDAVHSGLVVRNERTVRIQERAREYCRRSIVKAINEGKKPDWADLIIGLQ